MEVLPLFLIFRQRQHRLDDFTIGQRQQVNHWPPARGRTAFRQAPHFHAVNLAVIGEEQNGRVRAGDEQIDRKSVVQGKRVSVVLNRGGARKLKKKKKKI